MNNFSQAKLLKESEKYYLVKLNAKRIVDNVDYTWTLVDNFEWEVTGPGLQNLDIEAFNDFQEQPTANDVGGDNHWHFNRDTKVLTVSSIDTDLTALRNTVTHALYFSSGVLKFTSKNPLDLNTRRVHWENRIETLPSFGSSIENNLFGFITTTLSNIEFNNRDKYFNEFFSDKDMLAKNSVTVWRGINEIENMQIVFVGRITKAVLSDVVNFEVEDLLTNLDETFYTNPGEDEQERSVYGFYPGTSEDNKTKPIPRLFGLCTPFAIKLKDADQNTYEIDTDNEVWPRATNVNVQAQSTSNNRTWSCCLTDAPVLNELALISDVALRTISGKNDMLVTLLDAPEIERLRIGSGVSISGKYFTITDILPDTTQIVLDPYDATIQGGTLMTWYRTDVVYIKQDGNVYRAMPFRDYNINIGTVTDSQIAFLNNFESNLGMSPLSPDAEIFYRTVFIASGPSGHANILKKVLGVGLGPGNLLLPINEFQFDETNSRFPLDISYLYAQDGFETRREFMTKILNSTFGYIHFDENYELNYRLFTEENISGEFSEIDFFKDSFRTEVNYEDTFKAMDAKNLAFPPNNRYPEQNIFLSGGEHEGDTREFEHILDTSLSFVRDNTLARIINIFRIISQPRYIASARLGSSSFEAVIGQDYTFNTKELRGTDTKEALKIISLTKNPSENSVLLTNIRRGDAKVFYSAPGLSTVTVEKDQYTDF